MISARYRRLRQQLIAQPKNRLITGAAGFIGSNLVEELLALGQNVVGLDNFSTGYQANIDEAVGANPGARNRFRMIVGDIRDGDVCRAACEGIDFVLHQAALGSVPWSVDDPRMSHAVNVDGFLNMLIAARDAQVRRLVYASSSAVYGDARDLPQVEERVGRALSPYAATKATNETYAAAFQSSYGLQSIGLRYFNVFGRRQDPTGAYAAVIPRWIAHLLRDEPCRIFGDGETSRDFCYIANTVQANLLAATAKDESCSGQVYNVACGESTSLNDLFRMIRDQLAPDYPFLADAEPLYEAFRTGDIRHSCAAIGKARQLLGFQPSHLIADGLAEALSWYTTQAETGAAEAAALPAD